MNDLDMVKGELSRLKADHRELVLLTQQLIEALKPVVFDFERRHQLDDDHGRRLMYR